VRRIKVKVFEERGFVVVLCPRISRCRGVCSTVRKYVREGYSILCLNTRYFREGEEESALNDLMDSIRKRLVTEN